MELQFTKMHGLGNDFVVIDAIRQNVFLTSVTVRALADRHRGIGCDQILLVEKPTRPETDFRYRIFNADGQEVAQCGNGARCFARFVYDQGLTTKKELTVETNAGVIRLYLKANSQVTVDMGRPRFDPQDIPLIAPAFASHYLLAIDDRIVEVGAVSMGNPHAVLRVANVVDAPVSLLGPRIANHPYFPDRVNVGFMEIVQRNHIRLRVFERGVGETQACGTAACAAVVIGRLWDQLDDSVTVDLPGGSLQIRWPGDHHSVWMTGSAHTVFHGQINLNAIMNESDRPQWILYATQGCHLCEQVAQLLDDRHIKVTVVEIAHDDQLIEQYGMRIPVLQQTTTGKELNWPFDRSQLFDFINSYSHI